MAAPFRIRVDATLLPVFGVAIVLIDLKKLLRTVKVLLPVAERAAEA